MDEGTNEQGTLGGVVVVAKNEAGAVADGGVALDGRVAERGVMKRGVEPQGTVVVPDDVVDERVARDLEGDAGAFVGEDVAVDDAAATVENQAVAVVVVEKALAQDGIVEVADGRGRVVVGAQAADYARGEVEDRVGGIEVGGVGTLDGAVAYGEGAAIGVASKVDDGTLGIVGITVLEDDVVKG